MEFMKGQIKKLLDFITGRLVYFVPVVLILSLLESLVYYGITRNIIHIDIKLLIIGFFILFISTSKETPDWKTTLEINKLIFIPSITSLFVALNYAEMRNYTGYVFGLYHIHPQNMLLTLIICIGLYSLSKYQIALSQFKSNMLTLFLAATISYALISVSVNSTWIIVSNYNYIIRPDFQSYDARMGAVWGDFYQYIKFVRENTDVNSSIAHPPQTNPWQMEGNELVSRYFLYPRQLNSTADKDFYPSVNVSDWIMISNGTHQFYPADFEGYPFKPVALSKIIPMSKSEIWVEPISLTIYGANKVETINLKHIDRIQINSTSIEESSIPLIESLDPSTIKVDVEIKSNATYSASLYQLFKSQSITRVEGPSNILTNGGLGTYTISYDSEKGQSIKQGTLYLKVTNAEPLPYLYTKAIGLISHAIPVPHEIIDSNYYEEVGNFYYSQGSWLEAKKAFNDALALKPDSAEAMLGLYNLYKNDAELEHALEYAKQLELMLPSDSRFNLGTYLIATIKGKI